MRLVKKLEIMMLAVFCMVCMSFMHVKAEESTKTENNSQEDMMLVYTLVPEDWKTPCLWAWADDGTNAFAAWPGGAMKADKENPGWYYTYIAKSVGSNIIVNANEGAVQTAEQATGSENVWVTITDAENVTVSKEQQTKGELPAYEATITISVQLPNDWTMPCLWAWSAPDGTNVFANWPGQELEASADGWYSYEIPAWVNSVILNGNMGEVQTSDISIEAKNVWITVADKDTVEVSYEKPEIPVKTEDLITIHTKVPSDWLMPCLWAWSAPDGTNVFANWPGQELTQDGEWYSYDIPNWVNSVIINGNLGGVQTTDISIEPKEVWIVVTGAEEYQVTYEEPLTAEPETVQPTEAAVQPVMAEAAEESNTTFLIIAGIVAVLAVGGGIGYWVFRKKSNKK